MHTSPLSSSTPRGAFILFEGLDRTGKSTHAKALANTLTEQGIESKYMNFPNRTTPSGQKINAFLQNKISLNEEEIHLLYTNNRLEMKDEMFHMLRSGVNLIIDRYSYSGAAFTSAKGKPGLDLAWCFAHEVGLPAPDAIFFMNCPPDIARHRGGYGEERFENEPFQRKVYDQFQHIIRSSLSWHDAQLKYHLPSHHNTISTSQSISHDHYVAPWIMVDSNRNFDDVHKDVLANAYNVITTVKHSPIYLMNPFINHQEV